MKVKISVSEKLTYTKIIEMTDEQYSYAQTLGNNDLGEFLLDFVDRFDPDYSSIEDIDEFDAV